MISHSVYQDNELYLHQKIYHLYILEPNGFHDMLLEFFNEIQVIYIVPPLAQVR